MMTAEAMAIIEGILTTLEMLAKDASEITRKQVLQQVDALQKLLNHTTVLR
jgi:hypothetical protein